MVATKVNVVSVTLVLNVNGEEKKIEVDTSKVLALAWTDKAIQMRPADPVQGELNIPDRRLRPVEYTTTTTQEATGVCWWDGERWVCG
ncbi:MAG TPA: hypothetical protein VGD27_17580 [Longimicrobiales bacterium]